MIRENILKIRERIALICSKINRDPNSVTILAVSKGRTLAQIDEVIESGITDIGENKLQEALLKYNELRAKSYELRAINWHMVGHLQSNKARDAVKIFDLIQSVDSLDLALEIEKQAAKINKIQNILIEIKTSPEETKFGIDPDEAVQIAKGIAGFRNIKVQGLMTIAPIVSTMEAARPYFRRLRELKDKINALRAMNYELKTLSMGMTDDFEAAIEEGADMVRLGRAIFEG